MFLVKYLYMSKLKIIIINLVLAEQESKDQGRIETVLLIIFFIKLLTHLIAPNAPNSNNEAKN